MTLAIEYSQTPHVQSLSYEIWAEKHAVILSHELVESDKTNK